MTAKPGVIHLIRRYLHYSATFIGNQVSSHKDFDAFVIYREALKNQCFDFPHTANCENAKGLKSHIAGFFYKHFRLLSPWAINFITQTIEQKKATVLHFHYGTDALMYRKILKNSSLPKVVSFYGWDYSSFPGKWRGLGKKMLKCYVFRHATLILAMSQDMKKQLINLGCPQEKIIVHYHGIDTRRFYQERNYPEKEVIQILMLSSFEKQKGQLFLAEAFAHAQKNCEIPMKLIFAGEGSQKHDFLLYLKKLKCSNIEVRQGYVYDSEAHHRLLREADIFAHPGITAPNGKKEGIPGALVEAMCAGLPVVSTWHAGIPEIIAHEKTGFLVKEWDVEALSETIRLLATQTHQRQKTGRAAQDYVMQNLDMHQAIIRLEAIYLSMMSKEI